MQDKRKGREHFRDPSIQVSGGHVTKVALARPVSDIVEDVDVARKQCGLHRSAAVLGPTAERWQPRSCLQGCMGDVRRPMLRVDGHEWFRC